MYYNFNNLTGRLIGASHMQPYFPLSARPLAKDEPPNIMYQSPRLKFAQAPPPPSSSSSPSASAGGSHKPVNEGGIPQALRDKQIFFQKHENIPLYLRGGTPDKVLFGLTIAIGVFGYTLAGKFVYESMFPKTA